MKKAFAIIGVLAALCNSVAYAAEGAKKASTNALPFSVVCSNAWLKGSTDKAAVDYKIGEDIAFKLSFMGMTNAIPEGKYFISWKRTGDDGVTEEGKTDLAKKSCTITTKMEKSGFLRLSAAVLTADGKPFMKKVGKNDIRLVFEGGAGVAVDEISARPEPKPRDFDAFVKELRRKVSSVPFKKIERTEVAAPGIKGQQMFSVTIPCLKDNPVRAYLALPDAAVKGLKMPCRIVFMGCPKDKPLPAPSKWNVHADYVSLMLAYDPTTAAQAEPEYYPNVAAHIIRALQYLKTIPEWNGRDLGAFGSNYTSAFAVMAGGLGEGVTKVGCYNVTLHEHAQYDTLFFARRIPRKCLVDMTRVGLGDDVNKPVLAVQLWDALTCEKRINWVQGAWANDGQSWFKGRDVVQEKLSPVTFHDMTPEHSKPTGTTNIGFKDPDLALRDKIVMEVLLDPADLREVNPAEISQIVTYAESQKQPITLYVSIPDKKVKDKVWTEFVRSFSALCSVSYPIYLNAGIDLPKPEKLPWYNVLDHEGVLRYSGPEMGKAGRARGEALMRLPKRDPVFAYAPVKLFKADIEKQMALKRTGAKLYKYLEGEMRKSQRANPARYAEAEHLLLGMRQACDYRLKDIVLEARDRPGRAWVWVSEFLLEWPDYMSDSRVISMQNMIKAKPELEKIAKLEGEMVHLREWQPQKNAEIKKRDAQVAAFRKKLEKFGKSKDAAIQGEATLILAEFDNPPQPENQQQ